ncbi:MAG: cysteine--tRNA ligase [Candidatus Marinimicrobia bacterium]|nr:cysteine--tRNA ligase [Candidatus Neomarinimicrobiota bacterium]
MTLKFYNTMSRKKEIFEPIVEGRAGMYNCGPTVYSYPHIGNLRAFMFADLLRRYLEFKGYAVTQVMNLTDVDDKIIKKCAETGKSLHDVTSVYKDAFFRDLETLGITRAEHYPEATQHIPEMVALVKKLLDKGLAYRAEDGNIFFKIAAFPEYGRLQRLDMTQMRSGARVDDDEYEKESVNDFALWKAWKPGDGNVFWETELGKGRPGWHIECSAMSMKHLGETFDIHTGGVDNLFPHHENEIAQSEGATGKPFARYWLHCEHLLWENGKMSKSLGNIMYIAGLIDRGYSPAAIRYALLTTHYRQKLNFTLDVLDAAESTLKRINEFLYILENTREGHPSPSVEEVLKEIEYKFEEIMDDDLNISGGIGVLFGGIRKLNTINNNAPLTKSDAQKILKVFHRIDTVLGVIFFKQDREKKVDEALIFQKIAERNEARSARDWARADAIRDELDALGIELLDRKDGTGYKIKN